MQKPHALVLIQVFIPRQRQVIEAGGAIFCTIYLDCCYVFIPAVFAFSPLKASSIAETYSLQKPITDVGAPSGDVRIAPFPNTSSVSKQQNAAAKTHGLICHCQADDSNNNVSAVHSEDVVPGPVALSLGVQGCELAVDEVESNVRSLGNEPGIIWRIGLGTLKEQMHAL